MKFLSKKFNFKIFFLILPMILSNFSFASELNFSALSDFGEVPIYLAVLVEIIQKLIVAMVLIGVISDVLEVVANADFAKLLRSVIMAMLYICTSTVLIRIIIRIGGVGGTHNVNTKGNVLYSNFKIIFRFLGWVQYSTAILVVSVGILFFIVGLFKFVASADVVQLVQSMVVTGMFLSAFVGIVKNSVRFDDGGNPKGIFNVTRGRGALVSATELNLENVQKNIEKILESKK